MPQSLSPRDYFLYNLSTWEFDIPLNAQWIIRITPKAPVEEFLATIGSTIAVDTVDFSINPNVMSLLFGESVNSSLPGLGLYFAQTINTPREAFGIKGDLANNGFLAGNMADNREGAGVRSISIGFLETNFDFIDGIIRPWVITASYRGLMEISGETSIKADIDLIQYTKGEGRPIRKIHRFSSATPFEVDGINLDYNEEKIITRSVNWVYNHYTYDIVRDYDEFVSI